MLRYTRPFREIVVRRKFPQQLGCEEDLYTVSSSTYESAHTLELNFFKTVDQRASDSLEKIEKQGIFALSADDRRAWATFIISLWQRNPERLKEIGERAQAIFEKALAKHRNAYPHLRTENDPLSFEDFRVAKLEKIKKLSIREAIEIPLSTRRITELVWKVVKIKSESCEFLCSDRPIVRTDGIKSFESYILIPLSPRKLFIATDDIRLISNMSSNLELAMLVNDALARNAVKEVYSSNTEQTLFISERLRLYAPKKKF